MVSGEEKDILNKFSKVQNACSQLKNCIEVIYDNALSNEELATMSGGSTIERSVATSAASMISTYLANARTSVDIVKICDYYKYDADISDKIPYFKQPVVSDRALEDLIFVDKELNNAKDKKDNDILKFVGETELETLISYVLAQKFPYANEFALEKLKTYLLSPKNLNSWASEVDILKTLPSIAGKAKPDITKPEITSLQIGAFKAYIGALVLDRDSLSLDDVSRWIERLAATKLKLMKFANLRGLYANDLRTQLEQFMVGNKSGQSLQFNHTVKGGVCHAKVTLGQTVLGQAEGLTGTIADREASSNILSNTALLSKYSVHEESIPIKPFTKEEAINKESVASVTKQEATNKDTVALVTKEEPLKDEVTSKVVKKVIPTTQQTKAEPPKIQKKKEISQSTKEISAAPAPMLTAEALNEQIMSQLSSKMASMVSELTSQILQNNNIPIANDQAIKDMAAAQVKTAVNPTPAPSTEPKKQSPKPLAVQNCNIAVPKKILVPVVHEKANIPVKVKALIDLEKMEGPAKTEIPKSTPFSKEETPLASKIELAKNILTKSIEQKKETAATNSKAEIAPIEVTTGEKKINNFLKKGIPPIPKIGAPLKAMPRMPIKRTTPTPSDNSFEKKSQQVANGINVEEPQVEVPQAEEPQSEEPQTVELQAEKPEVEERNITVQSEEATERIKKLESTDPIKLPLKTSCDKQAKAKIYEIFGRFKMFPDYTTVQLGVNDFYSICSIKDEEDSFMGEGRGSSKKIAEQIAATEALDNDRLKELVDARNKEVEKLLGVKMDDLNQEPEIVDEVATYKYFQPQESAEELPIHDTCDKTSMARLYAFMGPYRLFPEYESVQQAPNVFHSICKIRNTAVVLSEARGNSKKTSQQIAAEKALSSEELAEFLSEITPEE